MRTSNSFPRRKVKLRRILELIEEAQGNLGSGGKIKLS